MSISRTILIGFLIITLPATAVMTAVSYRLSRDALQDEIRQALQTRADTLMQQIDALLFERLENVAGWARLDLMQDLAVDDVDKRVSRFLREVKASYGALYSELLCTHQDRVIAASRPALIGKLWLPAKADESEELPYGVVQASRSTGTDSQGDTALAMRVRIGSAFAAEEIGELYALISWAEIAHLLDGGEGRRTKAHILLLDHQNRVIAASPGFPTADALMGKPVVGWSPVQNSGALLWESDSLGLGSLLVGYARSRGFQRFEGLGWQLLAIEPADEAFSPVIKLLIALIGVLVFAMLIAALAAILTARKISRPIEALTAYTRRFDLDAGVPARLREASGEVGALASAFHQMLSGLKNSQEQLVRAAKLAVVGEMAAGMAHEVRTPLGVLRSSAQLLARRDDLGEEGQELIGYIVDETERLNRLIGSLLDCARPRLPEYRPANIHDILNRAVDLLSVRARKSEIKIEVVAAANNPVLVCDAEQLLQIFLNLLMNAIQAQPMGGFVNVSSYDDETDIHINFCDDGPGLTEEQSARIFEPFVTYRENGVGLGLTVVQQFLALHAGGISVSPSASGGCCFAIRLPRNRHQEKTT